MCNTFIERFIFTMNQIINLGRERVDWQNNNNKLVIRYGTAPKPSSLFRVQFCYINLCYFL